MGSGWLAGGRFMNCVSKKCLMRRVRLILESPREPPSRVYRLADVVLDYLVGMVSDAELESYEVKLGVNIGAADKYDKALADAVIARLTGGRVQESSGGGGRGQGLDQVGGETRRGIERSHGRQTVEPAVERRV